LLHQTLSITKGHSGIKVADLIRLLNENFAFNKIKESEIEEIINHLIQVDLLDKLQHEVIIGIEGEKIVNSRDFYSVFKAEENFKVVNTGKSIGDIPFSPQITEDENLFLAAKIWKIKYVDFKSKKIEVIPANDGKKPIFFGGAGIIHPRIREKMVEIIYDKIDYDILDQPSCDEIENIRKDFSVFNIQSLKTDRPLLATESRLKLFTFTGTRINRTIQMLLNIAEIKNQLDESSSSFDINVARQELLAKWNTLSLPFANIDIHISNLLRTNPTLLDFSKWGKYLPQVFQVQLVKEKYFDIGQAEHFLRTMRLMENK
jgi:ATP-dependent Lhr-like helicase